MKYTKEEKLGIISELIQLAKSDNNIKERELIFIKAIASTLQISGFEVDYLLDKPVKSVVLKPESERILQFHRLVLVMNVDEHTGLGEVDMIRGFGLRMGLPPGAIDEVLSLMNNYDNKIVPPEELMQVFKKHYN